MLNTTIEKIQVTVTNGNSKLGLSIPSINLPAGVTCRKDAPCQHGCYAKKGNFMFANIKNCYERNLLAYKTDSKHFFEDIIHDTRLNAFVRWHSSGDIVDMNYFIGMCHVARVNKNTGYLCFTKKFELINEYLDSGKRIPNNLHIIFSNWDNFICDNPHNLPTTWVFGKGFNNDLIPKTAIPCGGKCYDCLSCWQLKKGQSVFFKKH